jgi:uncharacterized protein YaaN involved in tellurite resistance
MEKTPDPLAESTQVQTELTPSDKKKVQEISQSINLSDSQTIIQYGVGVQTKISEFSDQVLKEIQSKDAGQSGEILSNLMLKIKEMDIGSLSTEESFLSKVPILSNFVSSTKKFISRYEKVSFQIEKITDELHSARTNLLKDIHLLEGLYNKNFEYYKELYLYIVAGEEKLKELIGVIIPGFKLKAEQSKDPLDAQKYQDLMQMVNRFEKKIHDLKLSKTLSFQMAPQIRLIQNNNQLLIEKIQTSILNTIPLWKNHIVIAIGLVRQKKALDAQKEITKTTNDMLAKNSELLKMGSLEIAKESEKGIVDIETLKKINDDLILTIDETLKIQMEGKQKRISAETELNKLESDLKQRLMEAKNQYK